MNVPYVSQIDNAPARNDCGPACVLMLARWIDPTSPLTVAGLAREIPEPRSLDPEDDGTTAANLEAGLRSAHLTPTRGAAAEYPYIALVTYNKLPRQNRYVEDIGIPHWIVRVGDSLYHDPYWPGALGAGLTASKAVLDAAERGVAYRVGIVERLPEVIDVSYKAREPYDRVVHVVPQAVTDKQFDVVQAAAYPYRQSIVFSWDDAALPIFGLRSRQIVGWGIPVDQQQAYRDFVTTYYDAPDIPTVVEFRQFEGLPEPMTIAFSVSPSTVQLGKPVTVAWTVKNAQWVKVDGGVAQLVGEKTVTPTATTQYTLSALAFGAVEPVKKVVTVTVTPVAPPPAKINIRLGVNNLGGAEIADAMGRAGAGTCSISFNPGLAARIAKTYPNMTVLVRPAMNGWHMPSAAAWRSAIELDKFAGMKNVIPLGSNEGDNAYMLSRGKVARSPIAIMNNADRANFDLDCCRLAHAAGVRYALGGWSYGGGCDITDRGSIYEFVQSYERVVKESIERTGLVYFNLHMYSGSDGSRIGLWERFGPQTWDTTLPMRGDFNAWPATWKPVTIRCRQNLWTVERWRALVVFLVEYMGIDPKCIRFVSDEIGIEGTDSMPPALYAGSFAQNGFSPTDFLRYCDEFVRVQGLPTVWAYNGQWKQADSNFEVGEYFAANGGEKWAGYAMETYWPIMAQSGRTWWRALA